MASQFKILPELEGYVNLARKRAKSDDFWSAIDILREGTTQYANIRNRKQEQEQARQDQLAQEERQKQERIDSEKRAETRRVGSELRAQGRAMNDRERTARETMEEQEALLQENLPKLQSLNQMFRQATIDKSDDAFADALEQYSYLPEEFQKRIPLEAHKKRFEKVMEPPPKDENALTPEDEQLIEAIDAAMKSNNNPKHQMTYLAMKSAIRQGEGASKVIETLQRLAAEEEANGGDDTKTPDIISQAERDRVNTNAGLTAPTEPKKFYEFWKEDTPDAQFVPPPIVTERDAAVSDQAAMLRRLKPEEYPDNYQGIEASYREAKRQVDSTMGGPIERILNPLPDEDDEFDAPYAPNAFDQEAQQLIDAGYTPERVAQPDMRTSLLAQLGFDAQKEIVSAMKKLKGKK